MRREELTPKLRRKISSLGGAARAKALTPAARRAQSKTAAEARWGALEFPLGLEEGLRARIVDFRESFEAGLRELEAQLAMIRPLEALLRAVAPQVRPTLSGKGFREAVRTVMESHPEGMSAAQLALELEAGGITMPPGARKTVKARVYIELHKLSKAGEVSRREGRYFLQTKEVNPR